MRALALALLGCTLALPARATDVRVPMRLDYGFMRELLVSRAYTDPEQTARVFSDGVGCNQVILLRPEVGESERRLRVTSDVDASFGTLVLGVCLFPVSWQGRIESLLEPSLDPGVPIVHFRVVDSSLRERDGGPAGAAAALWDWVKRYVHPRLERLEVDLAAPVADLRAVLPLFLPEQDASRAQSLVDSLGLASAAVGPAGVTVELLVTPELGEAEPPPDAPEPALTPEEIARFETALARWDGFVTFVVKQAGAASTDPALREQLLEVLLDARYALIEALEQPERLGPDPVRPLFLETWKRLAGVLRELGPSLGDRDALRWLGFVAAADALEALDALGPEMNLEISADGLRRLARVIAPDESGDPLATPAAVDPALRDALGFDAPLPPPEPNPEVEPSDVAPSDDTTPGEEEPGEDEEPTQLGPPETSRLPSLLRAFLDPARWLTGVAHAATVPAETATGLSRDELARLNRWVPAREDLAEYLPLVRTLLRATSAETARVKSLAPGYRKLYGDLQLATAWQETCWRQYVRRQGKILPIRSRAGAVGLMQVNARAWRGFYDGGGLNSDVAYNARAGSEILLHYLVDLAIARGEHRHTGGAENLVRAAYAAYNGGPRHLSRYRNERTAKGLRKIDESLFRKYEAVRNGRELEVARCFG